MKHMLRTYEKEVSWKAGAMAIAVHLALLGALLISFNWKAAHPVLNVAEVELWDSLPNSTPPPQPPVVEPVVKAELPPLVVKEEPKPEPVVEPKVEEPKVDIALEKKKELEQKKAEEKAAKIAEDKRKKEQLAALQAESRQEEMRDNQKQVNDKKAKDELKKLQQEINTDGEQQALSAKASANAGVIDEYKRKIQDKIKGNVNNELCGDGKPVLKFKIDLLPTGELSGNPKLTKSSAIEACDEAVERAIIASQPLPLPEDATLKSQFRNLNLTFTPNN